MMMKLRQVTGAMVFLNPMLIESVEGRLDKSNGASRSGSRVTTMSGAVFVLVVDAAILSQRMAQGMAQGLSSEDDPDGTEPVDLGGLDALGGVEQAQADTRTPQEKRLATLAANKLAAEEAADAKASAAGE